MSLEAGGWGAGANVGSGAGIATPGGTGNTPQTLVGGGAAAAVNAGTQGATGNLQLGFTAGWVFLIAVALVAYTMWLK